MIDEQEQAGPDLPTTLRKLVDELGRVRVLGLLRLHEAELETLHACVAAGRPARRQSHRASVGSRRPSSACCTPWCWASTGN
ncbi:hypothetical protein OG920_05145 [Streptomyces europaeiscabiei]|uniref:hypothetical protein n=1 Tax=Streptomyces europaeiscabiei TaxID=146819 RepID=UPI0029BD1ED0|nr:hypothetical protein [Streptomyces europaeiscabiei]MDX3630492.1 hypothetical protein [Streptomyces europaeiscabiei]MDX3648629.1 hypothetical protein [Streptomyces europaeiscabiei]